MVSTFIKSLFVVVFLSVVLPIDVKSQDTLDVPDSVMSSFSVSDSVVDLGLNSVERWKDISANYTIKGEELKRMFTGNFLNTLQGRIPGLFVLTNSGEPGYDNPNLFVRGRTSWNIGANDLLILLDGFQVDIGALVPLSPDEVESVTLLKGPLATAMYGMQGGAGILTIRTKRGSNSAKNSISFNARYGLQSAVRLPKVMDAYDYTRFDNLAHQNDNLPLKFPDPDLYKSNEDPFHPNVNWYNEMLKNVSYIQDYNLSFRGGNDRAQYYVLLDYENSNGMYKNADIVDKDLGTNATYTKINLRANVDVKLTKSTFFSANISGVTEDRNTPSGFTAPQLFNNLMTIPATAFPIKNPNGTWGNSSVYDFNPVQLLRENGVYSLHTRTLKTDLIVRQKLDNIVRDLSLIGGISFANQHSGFHQTLFSSRSYEIQKDASDMPVEVNGELAYNTIGNDVPQSINDGGTGHWNRSAFQLGLAYDQHFGNNDFTGLVIARRHDYLHDGQYYPVHLQGLSFNFGYSLAKKYIVQFDGSYMGSADFQKGNRYGFFPAVGLGWIVSNEKFLKDSKLISLLKVRTSYGAVGNIDGSFRFLYSEKASSANGWIAGTNNAGKGGRAIGTIANPDATWEIKKSFNAGLDIGFRRNFSATIDVFVENRTGIYEVPTSDVPAFTGFNLPFVNSGEVHNSGVEATINYTNKLGKNFDFYARGAIAFARNEIVKISENKQPFDRLLKQGFSINQEKGLVIDGFYQTEDFDSDGNLKPGIPSSSYAVVKPGDLKFKDLDGNGIIDSYDYQPFGFNNVPEMNLGLNIGFKAGQFDFDAFVQGVFNRTLNLLNTAYNYTHPLVDNRNMTEFSRNPWTPENADLANTPRLSSLSNPNNDQPSNYWLRNGNFGKLRSVELGYSLKEKGWIKHFDSFRIFINGTNLLVFGMVDQLEPENLSMGYPLTKVINMGANIKF